MPAASLPSNPQPKQDPLVTYTDDHLTNMQQSVAGDLQKAGINVPYQAVKPIHVPDALPNSYIDQNQIEIEKSLPESFDSTPQTALSPLKIFSEHLDFADQIVTGRTHVIDEAQRFSRHKTEKEDKKMKFNNNPDDNPRGPIKKFVDWLHDE